MALPSEVPVRISSEAAGSIAMAGVSMRNVAIRDLVEQMLGVTGKDPERILEILRRGSLVSGESRLRWQGLEADAADLRPVLATFPDPDPQRALDPERCFHCQLLAGRERLDLPKKVGAERRIFRRRSFWNALMDLAAAGNPEYVEYSYRLRCDHYRVHLDLPRLEQLQGATSLLKHAKLAQKVRSTAFDTLDVFATRG